eukprot:COSAG02_NODE_23707_length_710_cov_1.299509_1_plen_137_part_01
MNSRIVRGGPGHHRTGIDLASAAPLLGLAGRGEMRLRPRRPAGPTPHGSAAGVPRTVRSARCLLLLCLSWCTLLGADETPPLSVLPDSPRPNRRYWRWEEFPPAELFEGCAPVQIWKAEVKDEGARRVANAVAELAA